MKDNTNKDLDSIFFSDDDIVPQEHIISNITFNSEDKLPQKSLIEKDGEEFKQLFEKIKEIEVKLESDSTGKVVTENIDEVIDIIENYESLTDSADIDTETIKRDEVIEDHIILSDEILEEPKDEPKLTDDDSLKLTHFYEQMREYLDEDRITDKEKFLKERYALIQKKLGDMEVRGNLKTSSKLEDVLNLTELLNWSGLAQEGTFEDVEKNIPPQPFEKQLKNEYEEQFKYIYAYTKIAVLVVATVLFSAVIYVQFFLPANIPQNQIFDLKQTDVKVESIAPEERMNYSLPIQNTMYDIKYNGEKVAIGIDVSGTGRRIDIIKVQPKTLKPEETIPTSTSPSLE